MEFMESVCLSVISGHHRAAVDQLLIDVQNDLEYVVYFHQDPRADRATLLPLIRKVAFHWTPAHEFDLTSKRKMIQ